MIRRLRTAASVLSLFLCVGTVVLWASSFHRQPPPAAYAYRFLYDRGYAATDRGAFEFVYFDPEHGSDRPFLSRRWEWQGFSFVQRRGISGWNADWQYTCVTLPLWTIAFVTFLTAVLPLPFARRRQCFAAGCCPTCGYDLRASKDRCPECGTAIAAVGETGTMLKPEAGNGDAHVTGR
ncbi:MAG TPA: hypothetical protein VGI81_02870 [Tepidisphaeraceae bacterium]|jgi:hypothetical protein